MEKTKHIISKADEDLDRNENSTLLHLQPKFSSLQKHRAVEGQIWLMKEDCATLCYLQVVNEDSEAIRGFTKY